MYYYRQYTGDEVNVSLESFRKTEQIFASDNEDNGEKKDDEALRTEKNVLIDATYKMTKYALPLFLLVVRTNVSYVPIAEFIVEAERTENIFEALQIIKSWNQSWDPKYFMLDYSQQEYQAVHDLFPDAAKDLCTFHVEQAWLGWCEQSKIFM